MARFYPDDRPVLVEEADGQGDMLIRWHCEPPAPGAWFTPTMYEYRSRLGEQATIDVYEWRAAWQRAVYGRLSAF